MIGGTVGNIKKKIYKKHVAYLTGIFLPPSNVIIIENIVKLILKYTSFSELKSL